MTPQPKRFKDLTEAVTLDDTDVIAVEQDQGDVAPKLRKIQASVYRSLLLGALGTPPGDGSMIVGYEDQWVEYTKTEVLENLDLFVKCRDITVPLPNTWYGDVGARVVVMYTRAALTISKIIVSNGSASYEVAGDLKYADDNKSFANAVVIDVCDTTSGAFSATSFDDATVPAGKYIYFQLDSAPNASLKYFSIHIEYSYD